MQDSFKIPAEEYRSALMPKFTGEHFDPDFIAQLAQDTGMKYIVPITKHHEGFCLFDSKFTDFKISNTPAKRDWIKELAEASRKRGLKVGFYYSQNLDWHHPAVAAASGIAHKGDPDKYVDELVIPQLRELLSNYGDVSILWLDIPGGAIDSACQPHSQCHTSTAAQHRDKQSSRRRFPRRSGNAGTVHSLEGISRTRLGNLPNHQRYLGIYPLRSELEKPDNTCPRTDRHGEQGRQLPAESVRN